MHKTNRKGRNTVPAMVATMAFVTSAVTTLQTHVATLGAGLAVAVYLQMLGAFARAGAIPKTAESGTTLFYFYLQDS